MAYIFGGNTGLTPEAVAQRRKVAEALALRAAGSSPQNLGEGLSAIGQALASRGMMGRLDKAEAEGREGWNQKYGNVVGSLLSPASTDGGGDFGKYRDAIASIESAGSGDYGAVGPETGGDRPYGRYQVMGANIPTWTKEAIGVEMTPDKFLADPNAQDATFDKVFGGYLQGGSPQDAASMWFTGRPAAEGANRSDVLGTTGSDYVSRFMNELGGNGVQQAGGAGVDPRLVQALSDPWMPEGQKAVLGAILQQQLKGMEPNEPPTSVQEFKFSQDNPGFLDYQKALKGGTTVNVGPTGIDYGEPEAGLAWARNPDGTVKQDERGAPIAVPYQGGKPYLAEQAAEAKAGITETQEQRTSDIVTQDVDRAVDIIKDNPTFTTGIFGKMLQSVGGFEANDARALIDTVKANVGFDRLQQMRAASPTGGALGPVSDFENRMLQSVVGSLDQSQTSGQLLFNLKRVKTIYEKIINEGIKEGDPMPTGEEVTGPEQQNSPVGSSDLYKKYGLE